MFQVEGIAQRQAKVWLRRRADGGQSGCSESTGRMERQWELADGLKLSSMMLPPGAQ